MLKEKRKIICEADGLTLKCSGHDDMSATAANIIYYKDPCDSIIKETGISVTKESATIITTIEGS